MPEQASAEGQQPVERTHDGATERSCYGLIATPMFQFACAALDKERQRSWGFKV